MFKNIPLFILLGVFVFITQGKCFATDEASLVPVCIDGDYGYCAGSDRNIVIKPRFASAGRFCEGLAAVAVRTNEVEIRYGYINSSAKFVIEPKFDLACDFEGGLAVAVIGKNEKAKTGYIDKNGNFVIQPQFGVAGSFHEGLAAINLFNPYEVGLEILSGRKGFSGKWGFIDKTGKITIKAAFDYAEDFKGGRAKVTLDGSSYYIDRQGKKID